MKPATLSLAITFLVALLAAVASAQGPGPGPAIRYRNNLMIICERREGVRTVDLIQRSSYIEATYLGPDDACTFKDVPPRRFPRTEDGVTDVTVDEYLIVCKPGGQVVVKAGVSRNSPVLLRVSFNFCAIYLERESS